MSEPLFPLFPLDTVLFPGCVLDLQIFEARYLDMLSACMKRGEGFGVVGLVEGREVGIAAERFAEIGCEALIRDWQQQPNGLLGLRVEGGRRFKVVRSEVQRDQLTLAEVEWLDAPSDAIDASDIGDAGDFGDAGATRNADNVSVDSRACVSAQSDAVSVTGPQPLLEEHADLVALLSALAEHPMVAALGMPQAPLNQQILANQLAYLLPFTSEQKIAVLKLNDPLQRLAQIQILLDQLQGESGV
ncbi:MAG: LON peptidase substrate-binding domain-containing protein [Pseudomonas sp.]